MTKRNVGADIKYVPTMDRYQSRTYNLTYEGKIIGWVSSSQEKYRIELSDSGFSMKVIDPKSFPPKIEIFKE